MEQQKVSFAHVNASHNHADGSKMPARASVPFQSSARDFKWDSWTQRIWTPLNGGIHSNGTGRQGTPRTMRSPNGRLPIQAPRRLGARVGQECAGGRGVVRWGIFSVRGPPQRPLHKTIDISIKMEAQEVKVANAPLRICFTMCYTIWARQWDKKQGRPNYVKKDFALITRNWQFVKSFNEWCLWEPHTVIFSDSYSVTEFARTFIK